MKNLLAILIFVVAIGCGREQASWSSKEFAAEQWRATPESDRYVFARDLIDRKLLVGKPEQEVKELLGPPSSESEADHRFAYVIKVGGNGFDQVYILDILVDPSSGLVKKAYVRGD